MLLRKWGKVALWGKYTMAWSDAVKGPAMGKMGPILGVMPCVKGSRRHSEGTWLVTTWSRLASNASEGMHHERVCWEKGPVKFFKAVRLTLALVLSLPPEETLQRFTA